MPYRFEQFLNARSAYGPSVDASGHRLYFLSDMTGAPALWSVRLGEQGAWPEPLVTRLDRVQQAFPGPRPRSRRSSKPMSAATSEPSCTCSTATAACHVHSPTMFDDAPLRGLAPGRKDDLFFEQCANPLYFDVDVMDTETGETRCVWQSDGTCYADQFSPDGRCLLVRRVETPSDHVVFSVEVETGEAARLTPGGTTAVYENLAWSRDGGQVFAVSDVGREFRALVSLDLATGQIEPLVTPDCDVDAFAISPNGEVIDLCAESGRGLGSAAA